MSKDAPTDERESGPEQTRPTDPYRSMGLNCTVYPLSNYSFGSKAQHPDKDKSVEERFRRLDQAFQKEGLRRTVEGILLVHNHGHPHLLLLQLEDKYFKLPGGKLKPGESELDGLKRKLTNKLAPLHQEKQPDWEIGDLVCQWWRPNFETFMYPYIPPHCSRPKECRKMFLVLLPEKWVFAVPSNRVLRAVPLFELFDNASRYGPLISGLPQMLSRFNFTCL